MSCKLQGRVLIIIKNLCWVKYNCVSLFFRANQSVNRGNRKLQFSQEKFTLNKCLCFGGEVSHTKLWDNLEKME